MLGLVRSLFFAGLAFLSLSACTRPAAEAAPNFEAQTTTGVFVFRMEGERLVVDVRSPQGIGDARIRQTQGPAPKAVELRLHLKGLEEFRFGYGNVKVTASVSSHGDAVVREQASLDGQTGSEIDSGSPYWLPIEIVPAGQTIPLDEGYFRVEAPKDFFASSPTDSALSFSIAWIDFYR